MEQNYELRVLELFSGIGGMHFAFKYAEIPGEIIAAMDINTVANAVYKHNHSSTTVLNNNIQKLDVKMLEKLNINMILMSPPCQPHTRQHLAHQRDIEDKRSDALSHLCELIPKYDNIQYILLENVKDFEKSQARQCFINALETAGFYWREFILSPTQFDVPNTRHRYYCLARKKKDFAFCQTHTWLEMPTINTKQKPKQETCIKQFLETDSAIELTMLIPEKVLHKYIWILDIVTPESSNTMCFTKAYTHYSEGTGSVFTPLSSTEIKAIFKEIKNIESNHLDNTEVKRLQLLKSLRLRYFTPKEVARLMNFPNSFSFPAETTNRQKYRLLGNSINVRVVAELIKLLCT